MVSIDQALDVVMQLPAEERSYVLEILHKRQTQNWREETYDYYKEFIKGFEKNDPIRLSASEAIKELHEYINTPD
jgi:hypothetical protein